MNNIIEFDPTALGRALTLSEIEAIARGKARVVSRYHRKGQPTSYRLSDDQWKLYEQVKVQGYFFEKPANVAWLAQWWLETTEQPCLRIRMHGKFATVSMDLITCSREDGDAWDGTGDCREDPARSYAASRHARVEAFKEQRIFLPEGAQRIDQEMLYRLVKICLRDYFDHVVRWRGSLWKYDGVHYRPTNHRWENLTYEAWSVLGRIVRADGSYFLQKMSDMKRIAAEIRRTPLIPEVQGNAPFWIERHDGDPDARHCIVRSGEIFDFHAREVRPPSPRFFATAKGAYDLFRDLALAAGAHPKGHFHFGTYTSVEKIPVENAPEFARQLRDLYWRVIGKKPPGRA